MSKKQLVKYISIFAVVVMAASVFTTLALAAHALVPGVGFESDGDVALNDGGTYDWANLLDPPQLGAILIKDPHSKSATDPNIYSPSGKFDQPENWSIVPGSVGSPQSELTNIYVWPVAQGELGGGDPEDTWLILGMERTKKEGTFALDFEFNQQSWTDTSSGPTRTTGDVVVGFELSGNPDDPDQDLKVLIVVFDPNLELDNNVCDVTLGNGNKLISITQGSDPCPAYGSTGWRYRFLGAAELLGPYGFGTMNAAPFAAPTWGSQDAQGNPRTEVGEFEFAEAAINLSELGLEPGCPGFGSVHAKSRSSLEVGSDLKDLAGPTPLPVECYIEGYKYLDVNGNGTRDAGEVGLNGWTIELDDSSTTVTVNDANGDPGYYRFENLADGDYIVSEDCTNQAAGWVQTEPYLVGDPVCGDGVHNFTINLANKTAIGDFGNGMPGITVAKTCTEAVFVGDDIDYEITVTNNGNVDLVNVSVLDTIFGELGPIASLPASGSQVFTPSQVATAAGTVTNDVDVEGDFGDTTVFATVTDSATCATEVYELTVTKTADEFYSRYFEWDITKSVTPASWDLFTGESGTSKYEVVLDLVGYTENDWQVMGSILIDNPAPMDALLADVLDDAGGITGVVDCPSLTVPAGGSLSCTYDTGAQDAEDANPFGVLNTATATLNNNNGGTTDFTGTAPIDFSEATVELVDEEATVSDTYPGSNVSGKFADDVTFTYERTFTCDTDEGQHDNTASFVTNDTPLNGSDDASVVVSCYDLNVVKDASPSLTRTYSWLIDKVVDNPGPIVIPLGGSVDVDYTVMVDLLSMIDSDWAVAGNITVYNSHPTRDAVLTTVSDLVSPAIAATVDCPSLTVPAGGSLACTYSTDLTDGTNRSNTATATQQLYDFASDGSSSLDGTVDYGHTVPVDFASASITHIDEEIDVTDSYYGFLGTVSALNDALPKYFYYTRTIDAPTGECGIFEVDNIADFVTNDTGATGSDDATVVIDVPCPEGCTPGFWQGGAGSQLWNVVNDPQWTYGGTNPFIHTTLFNDYFNAGPTDARLNGLKMYDLVSSGGTSDSARRAARDMVAAYLNESAFGNTFAATSLDDLKAMWYAAVAGGDAALDAFHNEVSGWNDSGSFGGYCPLP